VTLSSSSLTCTTIRCRTWTSRCRLRWANTRTSTIDYLYAEWNNKAVGFVSYGAVGGARAAEHLRLVAGELQMADVRQQVALSLLTEFENFSVFKPGDYNRAALDTLLDQVIAWSSALAPLREPAETAVA
jgi:NAD(P)H-dependent FMN reductase